MSKPYVPAASRSRFYVPSTLASDFDEFLNNDIPNTVMNFELITDWYKQFDDGYIKKYIRGELYPDSTKSRYTNTDNFMNIRCSVSSGIKKGDIVIDENNITYLLDWEIHKEHNNIPSRALHCNANITIRRYQNETVDQRGFLISESGYIDLAKDMPVNIYRYEGRPEWVATSNSPGILPDALTEVNCQYNDSTKDIIEGDEFIWGKNIYVIIDVNVAGVDFSNNRGVVVFQAKKKPGGLINER